MPYEFAPYPEFSWSESRERRRRQCMRQDYYRVYAQHNGWRRESSRASRAAWTLGKLTTASGLLGTVVHRRATECVHALTRGHRLPTQEELYRRSAQEMNQAFSDSRSLRPAFLASPANVTMLAEFFYNTEPAAGLVARLRERLHRTHALLHDATDVWDLISGSRDGPVMMEPFYSFILRPERVRIYAAADLIVRVPEFGLWRCIDWKTGRLDGSVDQLLTYGLAMRDGLALSGVSGEIGQGHEGVRFEGSVISLDDGAANAITMSDADIDDAAARARFGVAALRGYLVDVERNIPKPLADFPQTANRERCRHCAYRGLCHPREYASPFSDVGADMSEPTEALQVEHSPGCTSQL